MISFRTHWPAVSPTALCGCWVRLLGFQRCATSAPAHPNTLHRVHEMHAIKSRRWRGRFNKMLQHNLRARRRHRRTCEQWFTLGRTLGAAACTLRSRQTYNHLLKFCTLLSGRWVWVYSFVCRRAPPERSRAFALAVAALYNRISGSFWECVDIAGARRCL